MEYKNINIRDYLRQKRNTEELERVKEFSNSIIEGVKKGDGRSFEKLIEIQDMKKFLNQQSTIIYRKFDGSIPMQEIRNELNIKVYTFVNKRYRPYHQPNEIQMLINSMYSWLGKSVISSMYKRVKCKSCEELSDEHVNDCHEIADSEINLVLKSMLTEEEYNIFIDRFLHRFTLVEISKKLGISQNAVKKRISKILSKIRSEMLKE